MTAEELFSDLYDKYGEKFNWNMIPLSQSNRTFVEQLKKEIGKEHFLYNKRIWAVAKCELNDDVLYVTGNNGKDLYIILHLTYEEKQDISYPKYELLDNIYEVKEYLIKQYENKTNC